MKKKADKTKQYSLWDNCRYALRQLRQKEGNVVYKLRSGIPYRIQRGDMIYISYEKIVLQ